MFAFGTEQGKGFHYSIIPHSYPSFISTNWTYYPFTFIHLYLLKSYLLNIRDKENYYSFSLEIV